MSLNPPERKGILELLDYGSDLETPPFQRTFAWGAQQIDEFWADLVATLDGQPTDEHFLGLVVLDSANQIQDGQQRLATTLLFASEISKRIEDAKLGDKFDIQIATDATAAVAAALRQDPSTPLRINPQDQGVLLNRTGINAGLSESSKRLDAARSRIAVHFDADLGPRATPDARLGRLKQWGAFLRTRSYVVLLRVPPKDAHNIFETLNTRGVRLSNGDLVKSHLISRATDTELAISKWNLVTDALKDGNGRYEKDLESFLLHYYGSRYARTTRAEFFSDYRKAVAGVDALVALDELIESASLYHALAAPGESEAIWSTIGPGTQQAIELLNALALKQLRYLLLAVLRDFAGKKPTKAGRKRQRDAVLKLTAWSIRGLVDGRTGGGDAESAYIKGALYVHRGTFSKVADLKKHFRETDMLTLNDEEFEQRFRAFAFDRPSSHTRARAILYALEYQRVASKSGLLPRDTLTVEHVLPKSPAPGQWSEFSEDDRESFPYMLGNLLLIDGPSGANDQLANKEWREKRALIKSWPQQTPLTLESLGKPKWTKSSIKRRTADLAKLAVKTWKA